MKKTFNFAKLFLPLLFLLHLSVNKVLAEDIIKIAVFPRRPMKETKEHFSPLTTYLSKKLGKKVELVLFVDFPTFWKSLKEKRYDIVHYNQYHYLKSHKEFGYNVIIMNEELGSSRINAAILVRKNSGINNITDLKGEKIVFGGGKKAMVAYIAATHILRKNGLKEGDYIEDFSRILKHIVIGVFRKMMVAGGTAELALKFPAIERQIDVSQIKVLARGEEMPMMCWAVREGLDKDLVAKIKDAMIKLNKHETGMQILRQAELTGFLPANDKDYDIARKIVKETLNEDYY